MILKSVAGSTVLRICAFALSLVFCEGQTLAGTKLIVDDGRFQGSTWVSQLAVTADDRFLIVSDFENGVRTYDIATGTLVNSLVGHSLEGDSYYDAQNNIFLTTGDRKIKIWDFPQQKLIKTINQNFHSQFMTNVYIDSKKKYVFAQNVKYNFDTKNTVKRYNFKGTTHEMYDGDKFIYVCFYHDRYYMFNSKIGEVKAFDCSSDALMTTYRLDNYRPGTFNYFDYGSGRLFISYKDGVRIVDLESGASDYAQFDRSQASDIYLSCYGISADGNYLIAGEEKTGLVVLKKIEASKGFANNTREVRREKHVVNGIHALQRSNKVIYSTKTAVHLLDLETLKPVWRTEARIQSFRNIFLAPDGKELYITMGSKPAVNRHWFGRTFPYSFEKYFDDVDGNWGTFKPGLRAGDLPEELVPMWRDRARTARLHLDQGMALELVPNRLPFPLKGTDNSTSNPVEGKVTSPSGRYAIKIRSFGASPVYEGDRQLGQAPDLQVIYHVEYSPDERYVALGGSGRRVAVVDLKTGKTVQTVHGESYINTITFSPDNQYLFHRQPEERNPDVAPERRQTAAPVPGCTRRDNRHRDHPRREDPLIHFR